MDVTKHEVRIDNRLVKLTPTEFKLLARLVRQAEQVVTHRQLLSDVWGVEFLEHTHYLRLYKSQLRSKIEHNVVCQRLRQIQTTHHPLSSGNPPLR